MQIQVPRRLDYALRILTELASHGEGEVVPSRTIAENQQIPFTYLQKIVNLLASRGLLQTYRGKDGGIALVAKPESLTVYDVIRVVEGDIPMNICVISPDDCPIYEQCGVSTVWEAAQEMLIRFLSSVTVKDLVERRFSLPQLPS